MGQISVTLNGRDYRLAFGEGVEGPPTELAEYLGTHVEDMKRKFGQVGDDRLILIASLVVLDELWELRRQMAQMKIAMAEAPRDKPVADESARALQSDLAGRVSSVAQRLELLNERFGVHAASPAA